MACTLGSSFSINCRDSNGGISEIKVKTFDSSLTGVTETSGTVTMSSSALTGWYTYACEKETANVTDAGATNIQNGTSMYVQTVTYIFNKLQASFRNELKVLGQARVWIAVKDSNGTSWLFGFTRGMDLKSSANGSGTSYGDRSGYTLTFEGTEPAPIVAISNYSSLITV